jgi:amidohydrolase
MSSGDPFDTGPVAADLKTRADREIERTARHVIDLVEDIGRHPELGFREQRTASLVAGHLREIGLSPTEGLALTGVRADVESGRPGPTVAIIGELDAVKAPRHPNADPVSGAAHSCGHHTQLGMMLAAAHGLIATGILSELSGRLVLFAVPAEECVEVGWRMGLREEGKIEFLGGKQELIRLGQFDDISIAMMTHNSPRTSGRAILRGGTHNGNLVKSAGFIGRSAHAGALPHDGINALYAATIAMTAINAQRETFRDEDIVRVHPIITHGGDVVNAIPARTDLEMHIRGRTLEAMLDANRKVDRCLRAGAMAMGAGVRIDTQPGYLPVLNNEQLSELHRRNAVAFLGAEQVGVEGHRAGTTDMGDLSHLMPVTHPYAGGSKGTLHGDDLFITDYETAVTIPARAMVHTVIDLLVDDARLGRSIVESSPPALSKDRYLEIVRDLARIEEYSA